MVFYGSWLEAVKNLPREMQGEVLTAIIEYGLKGETTASLKPVTKAMLAMARGQIDANRKKYEVGVVNGKKGGRPRKDDNHCDDSVQKERTEDTETRETAEPVAAEHHDTEPQPAADDTLNAEIAEVASDKAWLEAVAEDKHIPVEEVSRYLPLFRTACRASGKRSHDGVGDCKSHFNSWLAKQLAATKEKPRRKQSTASRKTPLELEQIAIAKQLAKAKADAEERAKQCAQRITYDEYLARKKAREEKDKLKEQNPAS